MVEIRIDGPGKNALGTERMAELLAAIEAAGNAPLLFIGAGDAFSAGLNLKEVYAADEAGMQVFLDLLQGLLHRIFHHPAPTVAMINGHAIAGGCLVALACDQRIVDPNPKIRVGLNEVALGLRFPPAILKMVRARIPAPHLHTVLLGAALHGPEAAVTLGLADRIGDEAAARKTLEALSRHPSAAYADAKRALNDGVDTVDEADAARFRQEVLPVWAGPEIKAVIAGFLGLT